MTLPLNIDGVLVTWGDRLFYPGNRLVKSRSMPRLNGDAVRQRAAVIRRRIEATVQRREPQVMVKVTGGGRSMGAIAAHFRYISKNGRLEIEDQSGETMRGKEGLHDLAREWRFSGAEIPEHAEPGQRREALNIMLSMSRGRASAQAVQQAARAFAKAELAGHKYVMVLHDHQANPHVHISVRTESVHGRRLNPRKADLQRWRETFANRLRDLGIEAEATRQPTRGATRRHPDLWQIKAAADGRLLRQAPRDRNSSAAVASREQARTAWQEIAGALARSGEAQDRALAESISRFVGGLGRDGQGSRGTPTPHPHRTNEPRR